MWSHVPILSRLALSPSFLVWRVSEGLPQSSSPQFSGPVHMKVMGKTTSICLPSPDLQDCSCPQSCECCMLLFGVILIAALSIPLPALLPTLPLSSHIGLKMAAPLIHKIWERLSHHHVQESDYVPIQAPSLLFPPPRRMGVRQGNAF